ncbi:hypothetical protein [Cellulomonas hominis]
MLPLSLAEPTTRYLTFAERDEIAPLRAKGRRGAADRPRPLQRDPGTISPGLRPSAATRRGKHVPRDDRSVEGTGARAWRAGGEPGENGPSLGGYGPSRWTPL